jgi:hypothetical protein
VVLEIGGESKKIVIYRGGKKKRRRRRRRRRKEKGKGMGKGGRGSNEKKGFILQSISVTQLLEAQKSSGIVQHMIYNAKDEGPHSINMPFNVQIIQIYICIY